MSTFVAIGQTVVTRLPDTAIYRFNMSAIRLLGFLLPVFGPSIN